MKKRIKSGLKTLLIFMAVMLLFPQTCCYIYHFFNPDFVIGKGHNSLKDHYMNKEVLLEVNGLFKSIDVEEYVAGIMPGVIPPDYESEALKTQAVLIRTNVLKEMEEKGSNKASDLSYQYLTQEEREQLWGRKKYDKYESKIEQAVINTSGKVLKHNNELIMAMYHEVSIGKTASALEILGEDIPYLQSVDSNSDVEAVGYMNLYEFSPQDLASIKQEYDARTGNNESVTDSEDVHITIEESSENGFVRKASISGTSYSGDDIKAMLELASTNFYVEEQDTSIRIVCLGKGNCLGVSQYGANHMASQGYSMEDILAHYYRDVIITECKE